MQNSSMKKTETKAKNSFIVNGFNQIIPFLADNIYNVWRSNIITELALPLLITEQVISTNMTVIYNKYVFYLLLKPMRLCFSIIKLSFII